MNRSESCAAERACQQSQPASPTETRTLCALTRHNGAFQLLTSEDPAGFEALKAGLIADYQPSTETENILLNNMAECHWLAQRAQNLQNSCIDLNTGHILDPQMFDRYFRYQTSHTRAYHKSLSDLLKLRAQRRKSANGFEAQNRRKEKEEPTAAQKKKALTADIERLCEASMIGGPKLPILKAEFEAKWGPPRLYGIPL